MTKSKVEFFYLRKKHLDCTVSQIWKRVQNTGKVGVPICLCTSKEEQTPYALQISYIQLELPT